MIFNYLPYCCYPYLLCPAGCYFDLISSQYLRCHLCYHKEILNSTTLFYSFHFVQLVYFTKRKLNFNSFVKCYAEMISLFVLISSIDKTNKICSQFDICIFYICFRFSISFNFVHMVLPAFIYSFLNVFQ